jgi:NADPH:quinone reductase-like Zn-dependent oxidoreductase
MDEVVAFAESGRLKPVISKVFDLADLHAAQAAFADKSNVGKIAIRIYSGDRAG